MGSFAALIAWVLLGVIGVGCLGILVYLWLGAMRNSDR